MSRSERFVSHANEIALRTDVGKVQHNLEILAKDSDLCHSDLIKLQKEEFKLSRVYEDAWKKAVNKSQSSNWTADFNAALKSYTFEYPPLYRVFNEKTREFVGNINSYHFRSYFTMLKKAIESMSNSQPKRPECLYRGCSGTFGGQIGDTIMFQHFLSTTELKNTAMGFGAGGTLFEIRGQIAGSVSLKNHSEFPGEQEWLVWPYVTYKILTISKIQGNTRKIVLEPCDPGSEGWCTLM